MLDWKRTKLEKRRNKTLSVIRGERLAFETMLQRARMRGEIPNDTVLTNVPERLAEIEQRAKEETSLDELDRLIGDAEQQGRLRAYICPVGEIRNEGTLAIDLMEEWNVPKSIVDRVRRLLDPQLQNANTAPEAGRSALRDIFEESDSWSSYTDEYEREMRIYTWCLFVVTVLLLVASIITLRTPSIFPLAIPISLAGVAGSCVSVMGKMPVLEVGLSGELESYGRRSFSRIGAGMIGSLIGSGLLDWGVLSFSIQGRSYAEVLAACSTPPATACTGVYSLISLAVPMVFGYSERALASFDSKIFGKARRR